VHPKLYKGQNRKILSYVGPFLSTQVKTGRLLLRRGAIFRTLESQSSGLRLLESKSSGVRVHRPESMSSTVQMFRLTKSHNSYYNCNNAPQPFHSLTPQRRWRKQIVEVTVISSAGLIRLIAGQILHANACEEVRYRSGHDGKTQV